MRKKHLLVFFVLLAAGLSPAEAAESKPVYKWVSANEFYFMLPVSQDMYFPGNKDTVVVHPWGLGFRVVGNGERFSRTGALQIQQVKVNSCSLPDTNSFYIFDFLAGLEYMTPKVEKKPLRLTASVFGDFGLSDTTLFIAPIISAGLLYTTDEYASTPAGLTFNIFYRLTDVDLNDVGGGHNGTLKPAIGFKAGYIFEGFWTTKENAN